MSAVAEIADRLRQAELTAVAVPPVRGEIAGDDVATAYAIQEHRTAAGLRASRRLVGRKIGLTAKSVQRQLGVDQPDYGTLFADMEVADGDEIPAGLLIAPRVEAEMAFLLGRDLDVPEPTMADVLRAVDAVLPAIEVVDSRIAAWDIRITDTIADNASSGVFVVGTTGTPLDAVNPVDVTMTMRRRDQVVSQGTGRACLGDPLNALAWLAATAVGIGSPLRAGDLVLSGALGPMVTIGPGDVLIADISPLGTVTARFTQREGQQ